MLNFASLLALAPLAAAQVVPLFSTTASVTQCQGTQINWATSYPPVSISIHLAGHSDPTPLVDLGSRSGNTVTWIANVQAGTSITFMVTDSRGASSTSKAFTVQPGSSSDCLSAGEIGSPDGEAATRTQTDSPTGTGDSPLPTGSPNAASSNAKVGLFGLLGLAAVIVVV